MKKLKLPSLEKLRKIKRVNLKIDITFWVFKPYVEQVTYEINGSYFRPKSYRLLCFALVVVKEDAKVEFKPTEDFKKAVNKLDKDAKTNNTIT